MLSAGYRTAILTLSGYTAPTLVKTTSDAVSRKGVPTKSAKKRKRMELMATVIALVRLEYVGREKRTAYKESAVLD